MTAQGLNNGLQLNFPSFSSLSSLLKNDMKETKAEASVKVQQFLTNPTASRIYCQVENIQHQSKILFFFLEDMTEVSRAEASIGDLKKLRRSIKSQLPGCFLPTIKTRKSTFLDSLFIESFINFCLRHPFICDHISFKTFIYGGSQTSNQKSKGLGYLEWERFAAICPSPENPLEQVEDVYSELTKFKKVLKNFKKEVKKYLKLVRKQQNMLIDVKAMSNNWFETESSVLKKLQVKIETASQGENIISNVSNFVSNLQKNFAEELNSYTEFSSQLERIINFEVEDLKNDLNSFKKELERVKKVNKNFIKSRKRFRSVKEKYFNELEDVRLKNNIEKETLREGNNQQVLSLLSDDKLHKLSRQVEKRQKQHQEVMKEYHFITRGLLFVELNRFKYIRAIKVARLLEKLSEANSVVHQKQMNIWKTTFKSIPGFQGFFTTERIEESKVLGKLEIDMDLLQSLNIEFPEKEEKDLHKDEMKNAIEYEVIYEFTAENPEERSLKIGERVKGEISKDNPEWVWIFARDVEEGLEEIAVSSGYAPLSHLRQVSPDVKPLEEEAKPTVVSESEESPDAEAPEKVIEEAEKETRDKKETDGAQVEDEPNQDANKEPATEKESDGSKAQSQSSQEDEVQQLSKV
eukprot:maker-scaffold_1-snap-gene-29.42-mRNA-1 protein AED:0.00 eAED:0.00 QI:115/1/1/1/0/0/2/13/634